MRLQHIWAVFKARNHEFFRDREAFGWNFVFPFLIIGAFAFLFGQEHQAPITIGIYPRSALEATPAEPIEALNETSEKDASAFTGPDSELHVWNAQNWIYSPSGLLHELREAPWLRLIPCSSLADGLTSLRRHQIDLLLQVDTFPLPYWINEESASSMMAEKLLESVLITLPSAETGLLQQQAVAGSPLRYVEWLFPAVLAMNMMFGALWGVGFVVVRYRKNGALKRLQATPLTSLEYLSAQLLSRMLLQLFIILVMWFGCDWLFNFTVEGSLLLILMIYMTGSLTLCALGLLVASRGTSEEFTNGLINFIALPMMLLSEVWFSLESSVEWVQHLATWMPLYHIVRAVRAVMLDGAGLAQVLHHLFILLIMALVGLVVAGLMFSWHK